MKNNLYLILLGVALLGVYVVGTFQSDYENSKVLFSEKFLEQLKSVKIKHGPEEIVLAKAKEKFTFGLDKEIHTNQWLIVQPNLAAPNLESLNKFFSSLSQLKSLHQFDSAVLAEFGLVEPQAVLELESAGGSKILKMGSTNPVSKRRYAQIEGNKMILLVEDAAITRLLKLEFRDLQPLRIPFQNLSKFRLEGRSTKTFIRSDGLFSIEGERNFDSFLLAQYVEGILSLPALRTVNSKSTGPLQSKLILDWFDSKGASKQTELEILSTQSGNFLLKLPGGSVVYEYGPEIERLLNRRLESLLNKKILRSVILEDFFGSCPEHKVKGECQPKREAVESIQEIIQRVEVLDLERLPGRLMSPSKPECRLKLESSKVLFEVLGQVKGDETETLDSPRFFNSDVGSSHYRGIVSGVVAKEFCQAIDRLCSEVRAACAG